MSDAMSRLSPEEQFILTLYARTSSLARTQDSASPPDGWKLLKVLKTNKLLRRTAFECKVNNKCPGSDDEFLVSRFNRFLLLWEREKRIYLDALADLNASFGDEGIESCVLKGLSLGLPDIPRDVGDLDILIRETDLLKAIDIMTAKGYVYVGDRRKAFLKRAENGGNFSALMKWSNQYEFLDEKTGLLVELHTNFFERKRVYHFDMDPLWHSVDAVFCRKLASDRLGCNVLCTEDRLWLLAMHAGIRGTQTRGMFIFRHYLDMAELIRNNTVDWDALYRHGDSTDTLGFMYFTFTMLALFFPDAMDRSFLKRLKNGLSRGKITLHDIQLRCFRSMTSFNKFYVLLYKIMLPFCYNGSAWERLLSVLIIPRAVRERAHLANMYGIDPRMWYVPFLYLWEPCRIFGSCLRRFARLFVPDGENGKSDA